MTNTPESLLLSQISNVECTACGLIYKNRWFQADVIADLFYSAVPTHPRGWDVRSKRFTHANFSAEIDLYETAIQQSDAANSARYQRALSSIVDSMQVPDAPQLKPALQRAIDQQDVAELRSQLPALHSHFDAPFPFKRFSGYSAPALWQWFAAQLGPITRYAELGCPLWGFLNAPIANRARRSFIQRTEPNYWGKSCQQNGQTCVAALNQRTQIAQIAFAQLPADHFDLIGVYQYLDHVDAPFVFLQTLLHASQAVALIVDAAELPCAIQHRSAWPDTAISALATRLECRVITGFSAIAESGNALFVLQKA